MRSSDPARVEPPVTGSGHRRGVSNRRPEEGGRTFRDTAGFTLVELLIAVALIGLLAWAAAGFRSLRDATGLEAAARVGRAALVRARTEAVTRGERVRIRMEQRTPPVLVVRDARERVIERFRLVQEAGGRLDSAVLRRSTLSFNPRGQAAPGSLYLYRDGRGIRLVVNFIGRIRRERIDAPSP